MKTKLAVFLCLVLLFITTTGFSSPKHATTNEIEEQLAQKLTDEQLELYEQFKENGGKITTLTSQQEKAISKAENKNAEVKEFKNNDIKGFKEIKLDKDQSSYLISDDGSSLYIKFKAYQKEENYILAVSVYNPEKDAITNFFAQEKVVFTGDTVDESNNIIVNYNIANDDDNGGEISTLDFKWNGQTFVCGMSGVFLCIQYCGVWTLINPGAGVICDIACGAAFTIACM